MIKLTQKGFTLIELMIAIAIVAILAAIALPAYLDYTTRAKVSEGLIVIDGMKLRVEELFYTDGKATNAKLGSFQTKNLGKYVENATWVMDPTASANASASYISVKYGDKVAPVKQKCLGIYSSIAGIDAKLGNTITATQLDNPKITWKCVTLSTTSSESIDFRYLPPNCRTNSDKVKCP